MEHKWEREAREREGDGTNLRHVVPVGDDTVLDGVLEGQDTTLRLSLVSNVQLLLA